MSSRGRPSRLTKAVQEKFVEIISSGVSLETASASLGMHPAMVRRWMYEGKDPNNHKQRAFRLAIKKARADAEMTALKNIQAAGLDHRSWQANAWYLQHVVQGKYLKSAVAVRPMTQVTLSDIARDLESEDEHSNGQPDTQEAFDSLSERSGSFFPPGAGLDDSGSQPTD